MASCRERDYLSLLTKPPAIFFFYGGYDILHDKLFTLFIGMVSYNIISMRIGVAWIDVDSF